MFFKKYVIKLYLYLNFLFILKINFIFYLNKNFYKISIFFIYLRIIIIFIFNFYIYSDSFFLILNDIIIKNNNIVQCSEEDSESIYQYILSYDSNDESNNSLIPNNFINISINIENEVILKEDIIDTTTLNKKNNLKHDFEEEKTDKPVKNEFTGKRKNSFDNEIEKNKINMLKKKRKKEIEDFFNFEDTKTLDQETPKYFEDISKIIKNKK
jgi:hypothetical protein